MEKRLGAALIAGDAVISIDNIAHPLGGELLCQAITQPVLSIRILGKSELPVVASNALFFANGNNLILVGDAVRRTIIGSLDAECERPELRKFKSEDPIKTAKRERPRFVHAALTILRAFRVAGQPQQTEPLGSFEVWSQWVRDALVWLGEGDPCLTMERARTEDPKLAALAAVMRHWQPALGIGTELSVKQLIDRATDTMSTALADPDRRQFLHPDFREALLTVAGQHGAINSMKLGYWLRSVKRRVVNRKRIVSATILHGDNRWKLEELNQ
jgi:putative DNA primase/helicase